jgi:hypothetical protein
LVGGALEPVGGKGKAVQEDGQDNKAEHREEEPEVGER